MNFLWAPLPFLDFRAARCPPNTFRKRVVREAGSPALLGPRGGPAGSRPEPSARGAYLSWSRCRASGGPRRGAPGRGRRLRSGADRRPTRRARGPGWLAELGGRAEGRVRGVAAWGRRARRPSRAPPARSPLEAGELCGRRCPRSLPRPLPLRHALGPGPDQLPWYFQNCRGQASLCRRGSPRPRPGPARDLGSARGRLLRSRRSPGGRLVAPVGEVVAGVLPWTFLLPQEG